MISFLFLHENICCGYSLEAPRNICFRREIRKFLCGYPLLFVVKSDLDLNCLPRQYISRVQQDKGR